MKSRQVGALAIIFFLGVLPMVPYSVGKSHSGYFERLTIYTAGTSALWYVTLGGINASAAALSNAEANTGLASYNLTAIKTTGWDSDFQVFGPRGYNLINLPFIPDQGLFLTLKASDASTADRVVAALDSYLAAVFSPLSNESGTYTYFSPVSFSTIVPGTLLKLVPQGAAGFASLIKSTQFIGLASPIVSLSGERTPRGFYHVLTLESIKGQALAGGALQLLTLFGSSPSSLQASKLSYLTTIYMRSLDGFISSSDKATVRNQRTNFSGSYSYTVNQTSKIAKLNLTVLQSPAVVVATRILDRGVLNPGDRLSVTLRAKNIAALPVQGFTVKDDWWRSYPNFFSLASGNSSFTIPSIGQGEEVSRTYVLLVNSSDKGQVVIPSVPGRYSYRSGVTLYNGTALFNQAQVMIGSIGAALSVSAQPSGASGNPLGTPENFTITITNNGNGPALNVKVANSTNPSLAQGSQPWVVSVPIKVSNILQSNVSRVFSVSWQTPEGGTSVLRSNLATLFFSHSSMEVGFARVAVNATITPLSSSGMNLTLKYTTTNSGHALVDSISSLQRIPLGLTCGKFSGGNITCSNGNVALNYRNLQNTGAKQASVSFLAGQRNLVFTPASFNFTSGGLAFKGASGGLPVPAGLAISKTLAPNPLFGGMSPAVTVATSNLGSYSFYNATVSSAIDSFDRLPSPPPITQKFFSEVKPGTSSSFNYTVLTGTSSSGTLKLAGVSVQLVFGGTRFNLNLPQGNVTILQPLKASLTSSPSNPVEGSDFVLRLTISNPSSVMVTEVSLTLQLPRGLQVVTLSNAAYTAGAVEIDIQNLGAARSYSANVTLKSASGLSFSLSQGTLTFGYGTQRVKGLLSSQSVTVSEDILTRYGYPLVIALLGVLATAATIRRRVTSPPSPR